MSPVPWNPTAFVNSTVDVPVVTTAETVIATSAPLSTDGPNRQVQIRAWVQLLIGASTTALTFRIRRGLTVAGVLVGEANVEVVAGAAGSAEDHSLTVTDAPGEVAGQSWVLTVQQTGATGNATAQQAGVETTVQ